MNKAQLIGRLTKDPDIRMTPSGKKVARFTVAINRRGQDDKADFISCVAFEKTADVLERYVFKGDKIGIIGRIQTGSYDKNGHTIYTTDIVVEELEFLENKKNTATQEQTNQGGYNNNYNENDDLPFF